MSDKQRTLKGEVRFEGKGIHSGKPVRVVLKPAPESSGILFSRSDIDSAQRIPATVEYACQDHDRQTSVGNGRWAIKTIEHLLAALHGLGVDNLFVEVDGEELPAMDGSAQVYTDEMTKIGFQEQNAEREYLEITMPIYFQTEDSSIVVLPSRELSICYMLNYGHPDLSDQFFSTAIRPEEFASQIAPARTFCLKHEAEALRRSGFGKGADLTNTLVFEKNQPMQNSLRFENEAARHKTLDLLGDLMLIGQPIKAHIIASRTGHHQNYQLVKRLSDFKTASYKRNHTDAFSVGKSSYSIEAIKSILPHRYPFLLVDEILEIEPGKRILGLKKVARDEYFFQGHFPGHPVMPGVLIVEALAQCGGFLMLSKPENRGKIAYFMTINEAKFRQPVMPGDDLKLEAIVVRERPRAGECAVKAYVGEKLVCEAEVRFAVVENKSS